MNTAEHALSNFIGFESAGLRMTPAQFDAIEDYDELYRYELADGVLVVREFDPDDIADVNEQLGNLLFVWYRDKDMTSESVHTRSNRFIYMENSRRLVHRLVWTGFRKRPSSAATPTIAVDLVTSGMRHWLREYLRKSQAYLAVGVKEYWVFDRFNRTMTVFRKISDGHTRTVIQEGEVYSTMLLPGFELPLDELLSAADKWENEE